MKRYKLDPCDYDSTKSTMCEKIIEDPNGQFVLYEDIKHLLKLKDFKYNCTICGKKTNHRHNGEPRCWDHLLIN